MPEYKLVTIAYHDDPDNHLTTFVCVEVDWAEQEAEELDDKVFFYFDTQEQYEEAKQIDNGLEFRIIKEDSE